MRMGDFHSPRPGSQRLIARTILLTVCLLAANALAQTPTTQPAEAGNAADRAKIKIVNGKPSSGFEIVDETLDKLEARGKAAKAIEAKIVYDFITAGPIEGLEESQKKFGTLFFVQSGTPQFLVHFDTKEQGGIIDRTPEYYAFDGLWLTERNDRSKTVIKREIVKPGQNVDLFDLGKGPFPLPFGRSRAEMLRYFEIRLHENEPGKPIKLRCLPRVGTDLESRYRYVDLYVDRKLDMPTRVVCQRKVDDNRIEVSFADVSEHAKIDPKRFVVPVPKDFHETIEPLNAAPKPGAPAEKP